MYVQQNVQTPWGRLSIRMLAQPYAELVIAVLNESTPIHIKCKAICKQKSTTLSI